MATKRCRKGSRKCLKGKCVKPRSKSINAKRCKKGTRKCADRKCHRTKKSVSKKYSYRLRNRTT